MRKTSRPRALTGRRANDGASVMVELAYGSFLENRGIAQLSDGVDIMRNELGYYFAGIGTGIK